MQESEYSQYIRARFDHGQKMTYDEESTFLSLLDGPEQYQNENEMIEYAQEHPKATLQELYEYWNSITPPGLPPNMTEEDLMDDEDD